jgi:tetratricopeptide (TPR) repeat protein
MRINRFSPALLIGLILCMSDNERGFAGENGEANPDGGSTATAEQAAMRGAAYEARCAARAAADEGFFLGRRGDFGAAREKLGHAIEADPGFSPAYRLRAGACLQMRDWTGAIVDLDRLIILDPNDAEIFNERGFARRQLGDLHGAQDDFDRCIALGADLALAYANRAEVEEKLGEERDAAADIARAQSLAPALVHPPAAGAKPSARKKQTHHDAGRTSNGAKRTTR